jgi:hypothetical protein
MLSRARRYSRERWQGHNMSLIAANDLAIPGGRLVVDSFNICPLCDAISGLYFSNPGGNGPPAGVQIDNGKLSDDDTVPDDADVQDPAIPKGFTPPFPVLLADFDTVSHANPTGPPTIGDSTLVALRSGQQWLRHPADCAHVHRSRHLPLCLHLPSVDARHDRRGLVLVERRLSPFGRPRPG